MGHQDFAGVAGQSPGRFRGNGRSVFDFGLAGWGGVFQDGLVDVVDDLVTVASRSFVEAVGEGALEYESQGIGAAMGYVDVDPRPMADAYLNFLIKVGDLATELLSQMSLIYLIGFVGTLSYSNVRYWLIGLAFWSTMRGSLLRSLSTRNTLLINRRNLVFSTAVLTDQPQL